MAISLSKGGNVSLSKESPGLTTVMIGLGWDMRKTDGTAFDLDAILFMCDESGKVRSDMDFIFYGMYEDKTKPLISACGSVHHHGDNRTGEGDGDDEQITINLPKVPADVKKLVIGVSIYDADKRNQNFGMVEKTSTRIVNQSNNVEIANYDMSEDSAIQTAIVMGELYRHNGDWKYRAIGDGFKDGLKAICTAYGVNLA